MEKAALLAGGVILIAYTLGDHNNNTTPGLQKLHRANLHVLPPPHPPADPIGLVPLAPKKLQPRAPLKLQPPDHKKVGEPISVTHSESRCMRLAGNTAWYNYPTPSTIDACYDLLVTIPCPASKCAMYWDGKPIQ